MGTTMRMRVTSDRPSPRRWTRSSVVTGALALLLASASALAAHDLFLKPERFRVAPQSRIELRLLNGTFDASEAAVTRDRVRDVSVVSPTGRAHLDVTADTSLWVTRGTSTTLTLRTGAAGTYVVGASTAPRTLQLEAAAFNDYLRTDGVPDILERRRRAGELARPARERYAKHVKALLQVGDVRTDGYATPLGYPAELVPLSNPYAPGPDRVLAVRALVDGRPVADQPVLAGGRTAGGAAIPERTVRTDAQGIARVPLSASGQWYIKFIRMVRLEGDSAADYASQWATLTFEVRPPPHRRR